MRTDGKCNILKPPSTILLSVTKDLNMNKYQHTSLSQLYFFIEVAIGDEDVFCKFW